MGKKILSICSIYPSKAGSFGDFLLSLSRLLTEVGFEHVIVFPKEARRFEMQDNLIKNLEDLGAEIKIISESHSDLWDTLEFIKIVKSVNPSLIHMHYYRAYSLFNLYALYRGIPLMYSEHLLPRIEKNYLRRFFQVLYHRTKRKLFNFGINNIICVSNFTNEQHSKHYGVSKKKLVTIRNGVNLNRFSPVAEKVEIALRKEFGFSEGDLVVTCVSVIRDGKGVENIVKAAPMIVNKTRNVKFLVVGDGPLLSTLKGLVAKSGLEPNFIFTGWRADVETIISISNVLVVPTSSQCAESFGFVAAEGMMAGVPVVASNIGGLKEIIEDGKTGLLAIPDNPSDLADKVVKILSNKQLAHSISEKGLIRARKLFTLERVVQEYVNLYAETLSKSR